MVGLYCKKSSSYSFHNKEWPLLAQYDSLCRHNIPKGSHVFHASQTLTATTGNAALTSSQAADSDESMSDKKAGVNHTEDNSPVCPSIFYLFQFLIGTDLISSPVGNVKWVHKTPSTKLMGSIATSYEQIAEILEQFVKPDDTAGPSTHACKRAAID